MVDFSQTLSLSVPITLFFEPKKPPVSQAYFVSLHKMQFHSSYLYWKHTSYFPWATMNWLFFFLASWSIFNTESEEAVFSLPKCPPFLMRWTYFRIFSKQLLWLGKVAPGPSSRMALSAMPSSLQGGYQPGSALPWVWMSWLSPLSASLAAPQIS